MPAAPNHWLSLYNRPRCPQGLCLFLPPPFSFVLILILLFTPLLPFCPPPPNLVLVLFIAVRSLAIYVAEQLSNWLLGCRRRNQLLPLPSNVVDFLYALVILSSIILGCLLRRFHLMSLYCVISTIGTTDPCVQSPG